MLWILTLFTSSKVFVESALHVNAQKILECARIEPCARSSMVLKMKPICIHTHTHTLTHTHVHKHTCAHTCAKREHTHYFTYEGECALQRKTENLNWCCKSNVLLRFTVVRKVTCGLFKHFSYLDVSISCFVGTSTKVYKCRNITLDRVTV